MDLFTIGYEKRTIDEFVSLLKENDVEVLADVRENAVSRKKGFSKTPLRDALSEGGIEYLHQDEVGNPSRFRKNTSSPEECLNLYEDHMSDRWDDALTDLLDITKNRRVCLMCYERDPSECHRTPVARELEKRIDGLETIDLK